MCCVCSLFRKAERIRATVEKAFVETGVCSSKDSFPRLMDFSSPWIDAIMRESTQTKNEKLNVPFQMYIFIIFSTTRKMKGNLFDLLSFNIRYSEMRWKSRNVSNYVFILNFLVFLGSHETRCLINFYFYYLYVLTHFKNLRTMKVKIRKLANHMINTADVVIVLHKINDITLVFSAKWFRL